MKGLEGLQGWMWAGAPRILSKRLLVRGLDGLSLSGRVILTLSRIILRLLSEVSFRHHESRAAQSWKHWKQFWR